jgi:ribosome-associated translation inhibitor RaiA
MGFNFSFGKKKKIGKSIRTYVADRVKEKRSFEKQLERLEAQLQNETVDQDTYERFRDVLEINFVKQREEALERFTLF